MSQEQRARLTPAEERAFRMESALALIRAAVVLVNAAILVLDAHLDAEPLQEPALLILGVAAAYTAAVLVVKPHARWALFRAALFTTLTDGALITAFVAATGGLHSPFFPLFFLSIASIAVRFSLRESLLAAALYSVAYAANVLLITSRVPDDLAHDAARVAYIWLLAIMVGSLASEERNRRLELAEISRLNADNQRLRLVLERVHQAALAIGGELSVDQLLARIAEQARDVAGARYAAIYLTSGETGAARFASAGLTAEERLAVGPRPQGRGLLGATLDGGSSIRIEDLAADPRSVGFPPHHPPMRSFLGVAIRAGSQTIGTIVTTEKAGGGPFDSDDQRALDLLSAHAATAIKNAQLFGVAAEAEALRRLDTLKSQLIDTISHEVRTPLSLVAGYADLLVARADKLRGDETRAMASEIASGAATLGHLADDLLDFARLDRGEFDAQTDSLDLTPILRHAASTFQRLDGGERIVAELPEQLLAQANPEQISEVVGHLLRNALHYAPTGPISLRAGTGDGKAWIDVSDQGPGISPEEQPRIWEKFYRGTGVAERNVVRGFGLGLAAVTAMVEAQGGQVSVHSTPGAGSTFRVTLREGKEPTAVAWWPTRTSDEAAEARGEQD
ncbi:MAG: sensor histidine kinase [Chloroflexota bacterium]